MNIDNLSDEIKNYILQLEQTRTDFVANVSHELRTPLTIILGYVEWMLKQNNDKDSQTIIEKIHQHCDRMRQLLTDLLFLSRLEDHTTITENELVNVYSLLQKITEEAKQLDSYHQHKINLHTDRNLALLGSESELNSLFTNLIFNAIKYTPAHGVIDINWHIDNKNAVFSIKDNGIGIAKKHIPRLTERFYRVDKARSRKRGGTGLGLAIVKHVLLHHQGKLEISSQYHKGSVFSCIFPADRIAII